MEMILLPCVPTSIFQVINKTDLAPAVGADLAVMERDALRMRDGGPFVFAQVREVWTFHPAWTYWMSLSTK